MFNYHLTLESTAIPNISTPVMKPFTELLFWRSFKRKVFVMPLSDNAAWLLVDTFAKAIVGEYSTPVGTDAEPPSLYKDPDITVRR